MEKEGTKGQNHEKGSQSPTDKIRSLERHPEMLGCIEQLAVIPFMTAWSHQDLRDGKVGAVPYADLDTTGFVSKCPEFIDVRTLPKGREK